MFSGITHIWLAYRFEWLWPGMIEHPERFKVGQQSRPREGWR